MLHLQEVVKQGQQIRTVILRDRLPNFLAAPCQLHVDIPS